MITNLEIEYKTSLTRESYTHILHHFPFKGPIHQFNTYYDTKERTLLSQEIMCRVRTVGTSALFTVKEPKEEGMLEYEFNMDKDIYEERRAQEILLPFHVAVSDLVEVTYSNTVRFEYKDAYGTWCLDVTQFPHHRDYELEYELHQSEPRAHDHFLNVLSDLGVEYVESGPKYLRALGSKPELDAE